MEGNTTPFEEKGGLSFYDRRGKLLKERKAQEKGWSVASGNPSL